MLRSLHLTALVGFLGLMVGCDKGANPTAAGPQVPPNAENAPPVVTPPKPEQDRYEIDPDKHVIPETAATGKLRGKTFTPDRVELEGNRLSLRQGKDFFADLEISMFLSDKLKLAEGVKVVVRPTTKWTAGIPSLHVSSREGKNLPDTKFINDDYAMTLELGKPDKGKIPGKIYLCLPDSQRSYVVGTFVAQRKRSMSEPPGAEEVPFIQGTISPLLKKDQELWVGYLGLPTGGQMISDSAGGSAFESGGGGSRSMSYAPRTAGVRFEKFTPLFDFTNLPPGRYLVYARLKDGPTQWKWVDVAADGRANADITLDAANVGTVEVKLPDGVKEARLLPADLGNPAPDSRFTDRLIRALELKGEAKDGQATIANVPPGKYQVHAGKFRGEVEVAVGKTAMVELKPAKE